ncbi:hypothetical protein M0805_004561 [Coniferiporia weirii]|nr:hypothetical protein M0805_004561 [Coniferiporia weirii]
MSTGDITMDKVFQHPTLYFDDGNIILSAVSSTQNQQKNQTDAQTLLFRVHKSLLKERSVIFRDMLELPEVPSGVNEIHDAVPVVRMPDSAKEVEDMLKIFYRPWEMRLQKHHPDTCLQIKDVLAMATKYQFSDIRQLLVAHIEADWPKTLDEWDWFEDYAKLLPPFQRPGYTRPEPASTLVLAWRFGIHRVLPAVFYDLGRLNVSDDWNDSPKKSLFTFVPILRRIAAGNAG